MNQNRRLYDIKLRESSYLNVPFKTFKDKEYFISPDGVCFSKRKNSQDYWLLTPSINNGYIQYWLGDERLYAHRLVYKYYIGDIADGLEVHHIDHDKGNNSFTNLELVTHSQNIIKYHETYCRLFPLKNPPSGKFRDRVGAPFGVDHGKFKGFYVVNGVDYTSTYAASKDTGMNRKSIAKKCKSGVNGFSFKPVQC